MSAASNPLFAAVLASMFALTSAASADEPTQPKPPSSPAPVESARAADSSKRSPIPTIIGAALSTATLGAGVAFSIAATTDEADKDRMARDAAIHFTAGGVLLGATLTYALWPSKRRATAARTAAVQALPIVGPRGGGIGFVGHL